MEKRNEQWLKDREKRMELSGSWKIIGNEYYIEKKGKEEELEKINEERGEGEKEKNEKEGSYDKSGK